MLKVSEGFAKFLATTVMAAQIVAALFFGYLWFTKRNVVHSANGELPTVEHQYDDDVITIFYAVPAIICAMLAIAMFFIRKSPRFMRLFTK